MLKENTGLCSLMAMYTWKRSSKVNYFTLGTKIPFQMDEAMSRLGFLSKNMTKSIFYLNLCKQATLDRLIRLCFIYFFIYICI